MQCVHYSTSRLAWIATIFAVKPLQIAAAR
jgi:hypothetical protein